ncbi:hypothetical protein ACLMJK_009096 [Lecanora helva]
MSMWSFECESSSNATEIILNNVRLFFKVTDLDPAPEFFWPGKEAFSFWQQTYHPHYYNKCLKDRFNFAISLTRKPILCGPGPLLRALDINSNISPQAIHMTDNEGMTLLHAAARGLSDAVLQDDAGRSLTCSEEWGKLIVDLIMMGSDLHHISQYGETPILTLLDRYTRLRHTRPLQFVLNLWLKYLREANVDAEEYGQRECDINGAVICDDHEDVICDANENAKCGVYENVTALPDPTLYNESTGTVMVHFMDGPLTAAWRIRECHLDPVLPNSQMPGTWVEEDEDRPEILKD